MIRIVGLSATLPNYLGAFFSRTDSVFFLLRGACFCPCEAAVFLAPETKINEINKPPHAAARRGAVPRREPLVGPLLLRRGLPPKNDEPNNNTNNAR